MDLYKLKERLSQERGYNVTWIIMARELGTMSVQTLFRWRDGVYDVPKRGLQLIELTYPQHWEFIQK